MNDFSSRKRSLDGRWQCVRPRGGASWPHGYCRAWTPWTPEVLANLGMRGKDLEEEARCLNADYAPFSSKHHTDGHATSEEAMDCGLDYELDHRLRFRRDRLDTTQQGPCVVCGRTTSSQASLGAEQSWRLCGEHLDREIVRRLAKMDG